MAGRLLRPVNGVNNVTTRRGDVIVGRIPANGARELNQNQIRHKKCGRQKTLGRTSLRCPVINGRQRGPYTLKCRCTTYNGGYIVVGSFARKQGNAQDTRWKCKGKTEKHKRRSSTVINPLWNGHSRGNTNRGDDNEVVQWPCKGGKAAGTPR